MDDSNNSSPALPADAEALIIRVRDDLNSDRNHVSIFSGIVIAIIGMLLLYIALTFLGSVGRVIVGNGHVPVDFIFMLSTAVAFVTITVSSLAVYVIILLRRAFARSYRETEQIICDGFKHAYKSVKE